MKLVPFLSAFLASTITAQSAITVSPGQSIQAAVVAAKDGDTIVVRAGKYTGSIDFLGKAITLRGIGMPTISGASGVVNSVVYFRNSEGPSSVLQGFEIRGGYGVKGGAIAAINTHPMIRDCWLQGNFANAEGGAVAGDCTLERCVITNNRSANGGGAAWGSLQMFDCLVEGNFAFNDVLGGGLFLLDGARVERCIIRGNAVIGDGAAAYIDGPNVLLRRCLITGNKATGKSAAPRGAILGDVAFSVESCTVCDNESASAATSYQGDAGICGPAIVLDSVVGRNSGVEILDSPYGTPAQVRYSDVELGHAGVGNVSFAPLFTSNGNYHLTPLSPCIDAGDPTLLDPDGSRIDIGFFPFVKLGASPVAPTRIAGRW